MFEELKNKRMSELTPAQRVDAHELWLRNHIDHFQHETKRHLEMLISQLDAARAKAKAPIDMLLFCPNCGTQHVDEADKPPHVIPDDVWTNPPHRSHLCHQCGHIWRPSDSATNGVSAIKTKGKNDSAAPAANAQPSELPLVNLIVKYGHACRQEQAWRDADRNNKLPEGESAAELLNTIRAALAHAQSDSAGDARDAARYRHDIRREYETEYLPGAKRHGLTPYSFDEYKRRCDNENDAAIAASAAKGEQQNG